MNLIFYVHSNRFKKILGFIHNILKLIKLLQKKMVSLISLYAECILQGEKIGKETHWVEKHKVF